MQQKTKKLGAKKDFFKLKIERRSPIIAKYKWSKTITLKVVWGCCFYLWFGCSLKCGPNTPKIMKAGVNSHTFAPER